MKPRDPSERRDSLRFPIALNLRYTAGTACGSGRTLNWSADGVLCSLDQPVKVGVLVCLTVEWPARLNNETPLNLVIGGEVLRVDARGVVIRIRQYSFKTRPMLKQAAAGILLRTALLKAA